MRTFSSMSAKKKIVKTERKKTVDKNSSPWSMSTYRLGPVRCHSNKRMIRKSTIFCKNNKRKTANACKTCTNRLVSTQLLRFIRMFCSRCCNFQLCHIPNLLVQKLQRFRRCCCCPYSPIRFVFATRCVVWVETKKKVAFYLCIRFVGQALLVELTYDGCSFSTLQAINIWSAFESNGVEWADFKGIGNVRLYVVMLEHLAEIRCTSTRGFCSSVLHLINFLRKGYSFLGIV